MLRKECNIKEEEEEDDISEYYDWLRTPKNAPDEYKTGVTFRGSDDEYFKAHKIVMDMTQKKGDRFVINGVEVRIADAPPNKQISIDVKGKHSRTGKANLKLYGKNKGGSATIMVTKPSGGEKIHVDTLAFEVIRYLLDNIISGDVTMEDVENMRRKNTSKEEKKKNLKSEFKCEICENSFATNQGLKTHVTRIHKDSGVCDLCELIIVEKETLEEHKQTIHNEIRSPVSKKIKMKEGKDVEEENWDGGIEMMDVDEELVIRSQKKDEKVMLKQKKIDEEEEKVKELKRKNEIIRENEEMQKKKMKTSLKTKKSKKKTKKDIAVKGVNSKVKDIPEKYDEILKEVGIDRKEYCICSVEPDGACGSTCTSLHCHRDRKLARYVRRNINEYLVRFWPFFQPYFKFPYVVSVGLGTEPFETEESFLEFLKTDAKSGLMWMDHSGLQVVSNIYQISIHILTTGVAGMDEPKARWTHLEPDERLSAFSTVQKGLPDMYLMHVDETHFDLIIRKDSDLAIEGSVDEMREANDDKKEEEKEDKEAEPEPAEGAAVGPGYMGWTVKDNNETEVGFKNRVAEVKEVYDEMRREFEELKKDLYKKVNKEMAKVKLEVKDAKDAYKKCVEDLRLETRARNEAETMAKVLKDTLDAKKDLEKKEGIEVMEVDEKVEDDGGEWKQQRKQTKRTNKRNRQKSESKEENMLNCDLCSMVVESPAELRSHRETHEKFYCTQCDESFSKKREFMEHVPTHTENMFKCEECEATFDQERLFKKHIDKHAGKKVFECEQCNLTFQQEKLFRRHEQIHTEETVFTCDECDETFKIEREFRSHRQSHDSRTEKHQSSTEQFNCLKCDKVYGHMRKLRRHDWRSHRSIECTICKETLENRQEIVHHRETKHNMLRKIACRYFPDCYDDEECLYDHIQLSDGEGTPTVCPSGLNCADQSCTFSEQNHRSVKNDLCRFQEKCNRKGCLYKHIVSRKVFLGESPVQEKRR